MIEQEGTDEAKALGHFILAGQLDEGEGDHRSALREFRAGVRLASKLGSKWETAFGLGGIGLQLALIGDHARAATVLRDAGYAIASPAAVLAHGDPDREHTRLLDAAHTFFVEALSPFEMAHRAFRDANSVLQMQRDARVRHPLLHAPWLLATFARLPRAKLHERGDMRILRAKHADVGQVAPDAPSRYVMRVTYDVKKTEDIDIALRQVRQAALRQPDKALRCLIINCHGIYNGSSREATAWKSGSSSPSKSNSTTAPSEPGPSPTSATNSMVHGAG